MRRHDREITDRNEILNIIAKCDVCRVVINDEPYPYIVPLNFGEDIEDGQLYLYFHSALEGTKMDLLRKNPNVTFEMDCGHNIILYDERMSCTMGYESVIGHGVIEFVENPEDKHKALVILMHHYHEEDFIFKTEVEKVTAVYRLKVTDMTGKRRNNTHPEEKTKRTSTL